MIRDFYCDREQTSALIKPREKGESKTSRELVHNEHGEIMVKMTRRLARLLEMTWRLS